MDFEEWWDKNGELYRRPTPDERYLFESGQQSKQAEIDKGLSDYQLEVSQVGQSCVKWKEIAEGKQAEIDALEERIKVSLDWLEWSNSKNDSAVRRAISSLKGE